MPCAGTAGSSSAVTAAPAPSTWPACPHRSRRSPGEPSMLVPPRHPSTPIWLHSHLHPLTLRPPRRLSVPRAGSEAHLQGGLGSGHWAVGLWPGLLPLHLPARSHRLASTQPGQQGPEGGEAEWMAEAKSGQPVPSHSTFPGKFPQAGTPPPPGEVGHKAAPQGLVYLLVHPPQPTRRALPSTTRDHRSWWSAGRA